MLSKAAARRDARAAAAAGLGADFPALLPAAELAGGGGADAALAALLGSRWASMSWHKETMRPAVSLCQCLRAGAGGRVFRASVAWAGRTRPLLAAPRLEAGLDEGLLSSSLPIFVYTQNPYRHSACQ